MVSRAGQRDKQQAPLALPVLRMNVRCEATTDGACLATLRSGSFAMGRALRASTRRVK